jgi:Na+/phosphate symporter
MYTTLTLIALAGAVALLIWGVHMVRTGVTRAFGLQLRRMLGYALGNRFKAFLAGLGGARSESVESGRLHLDIVRDLKRVNAHLSTAAYPVLEGRGELLTSRLRQDTE